MKTLISTKLSCAVMIGLLMPLSVANASDSESAHLAFTQLETYPELAPASEGAMGPIRSDLMEGKASASESVPPGFKQLETYPELSPERG